LVREGLADRAGAGQRLGIGVQDVAVAPAAQLRRPPQVVLRPRRPALQADAPADVVGPRLLRRPGGRPLGVRQRLPPPPPLARPPRARPPAGPAGGPRGPPAPGGGRRPRAPPRGRPRAPAAARPARPAGPPSGRARRRPGGPAPHQTPSPPWRAARASATRGG